MIRVLSKKPVCLALQVSLLVGFALLFAGCIKAKTVVRVKNDGSGYILASAVFSKGAVAMYEAQMAEMRKQMEAGGMAGMHMEMPEDPFYNEDALEAAAGMFGSAVKFVKAKRVDKDGARGSVTIYSFEDINDVFINLDNMGANIEPSMGPGAHAQVAEKEEDAFEFAFKKGSPNKLEVVLPDYPDVEPLDLGKKDDKEKRVSSPEETAAMQQYRDMMMAAGNPYGFTGNETPGEMAKAMFKDMEMSLSVEVVGKKVKSDANHPHPEKDNRFILLELKMDKLVKRLDEDDMMSPFGMGGGSPAEFFASATNVPGVKVETSEKVKITFE
ncbi:MAG: hypothetical protein ACOCVH_00650 [Verrucomicrobiota bacterium]